jgi:hypothetical protein
MPSASQFLGAIATPIGTLVKMPDSVTVDTFTDNSGTYLRCGVLIPRVSPDHDTLVGLGLTYNKWLTLPNGTSIASSSGPNIGASSNTLVGSDLPNGVGKMFALGMWGVMHKVAPGLWAFTGLNNSGGQYAPILVSEPPTVGYQTVNATAPTGGVETRSAPSYSSELGCWVIVETFTSGYSSSVNTYSNVFVYSSTDGATWLRSAMSPALSSLQTTGGLACAVAGSILHCLATVAAGAAATTFALRLLPDRRTLVAATAVGQQGVASRQSSFLVSVGPESVLFGTIQTSTANSTSFEHAHADGTVTILTTSFGVQTGGTGGRSPMVDRNDTQVLLFGHNHALVSVLPMANNRLTSNTLSGTYTIPGTNAYYNESHILWTGSYWVFSGIDGFASGYFGAFSTNAQTWTSPTVTGTDYRLDYVKYATIARTAMHDFANGTNRFYNFATSSGTTGLLAGPSRTAHAEVPVEFGGATITSSAGSTIIRTDANGSTDIVHFSITAGATFGSTSRIKVVNGRAFVIGITNNVLVHSADGITWTSVAITAVGAIQDVAFIGTNWVVIATAATNNVAYSSNLTGWTGVTIGSSIGNGYALLTGSGYLIATSANGVRRTADGATWTTPTSGTPATWPSTNTSVFATATTLYLNSYTSGSTYNQYASTDGNTWALTTPPCIVSGQTPTDFVSFNNFVYCRGSTGSSQVYYSATVGNFASLPTLGVPVSTSFSRLYVRANSLRYRYSVTVISLARVVENVVDAVGAGALVGYDRAVISNGEVSFVRVK